MKIKRKLHNEVFPHHKLNVFQYSKIGEGDVLECYYHKWFLTLIFIPVLIVGTVIQGFPKSIKELIDMFKYPIASYWLNDGELTRLK